MKDKREDINKNIKSIIASIKKFANDNKILFIIFGVIIILVIIIYTLFVAAFSVRAYKTNMRE